MYGHFSPQEETSSILPISQACPSEAEREGSSFLTTVVRPGAGFSEPGWWVDGRSHSSGCFGGSPGDSPKDSPANSLRLDLPGFRQCLSCCLLPSSSTFWFPFKLSLWGSLTLSVKPWWVESVSRRPRLTFLMPFNLPSGEGASRHFLFLCHLVSLQPPPTLWFLGWVSRTSPQTP